MGNFKMFFYPPKIRPSFFVQLIPSVQDVMTSVQDLSLEQIFFFYFSFEGHWSFTIIEHVISAVLLL